jgi:hypothetical protein
VALGGELLHVKLHSFSLRVKFFAVTLAQAVCSNGLLCTDCRDSRCGWAAFRAIGGGTSSGTD